MLIKMNALINIESLGYIIISFFEKVLSTRILKIFYVEKFRLIQQQKSLFIYFRKQNNC